MKIGIIFPGYGNQFVGMGKAFYDNSRIMQEHFEQAASCLDKNFVKLCFASSENNLAELENAYISLFLLSLSLADILKEKGIQPALVAGRDIGEYAALAAARGLSLPDAVYLLRKYAKLYSDFLKEKKVEGVRIRNCDGQDLKKICQNCANGNNVATVAVHEGFFQSIVTGTVASISCVKKGIEDAQCGPVEQVKIGGGLHSHLMDDVLKTMKQYLEKVDFKSIKTPFVASVTGQALNEGDKLRAALMQQIHAPLQWKKVLDSFAFCDVLVIAGPAQELQKQIQKELPDKKVIAIAGPNDMNELLELAGKPKMEFEFDDESDDE